MNRIFDIEEEEIKFCNKFLTDGNIIFDVGCRLDSQFMTMPCEVHYFDPVHSFVDNLKSQQSRNTKNYFNKFGLGEEEKQLFYYPRYQSFFDRAISCGVSDDANKITLNIKKACDYINENNIKNIDFLKIDTEGYELNVIKGFEEKINIVDKIQFEYGGTYKDNKTRLIDVISYLESYGFTNFYYLRRNGLETINNYEDHYQYSNIICFRKEISHDDKSF